MNQKVKAALVVIFILISGVTFLNFLSRLHYLNQKIESIRDVDRVQILKKIYAEDNPRMVVEEKQIGEITDLSALDLIRTFIREHESGWGRSLVRFGGPNLRLNLFLKDDFLMAIGISNTALSYSEYERGVYSMGKRVSPEDINKLINSLGISQELIIYE